MNASVFVVAVVMAMACEREMRSGKGSATRRRGLDKHLEPLVAWPDHSTSNWLQRAEAQQQFRAAMRDAGALDGWWE